MFEKMGLKQIQENSRRFLHYQESIDKNMQNIITALNQNAIRFDERLTTIENKIKEILTKVGTDEPKEKKDITDNPDN